MCLELFNSYLGLPFAWLALALFVAAIATLAVVFLFVFPKRSSGPQEPPTFTCPCYAPPPDPPEPEAD